MARRPRTKTECTMFPFLSVLCSMIGILMLFLIAIVSTRVMAVGQQPKPQGRAEGSGTRDGEAKRRPPEPGKEGAPGEGIPEGEGIDEARFDALSQQIERLAAEFAQRHEQLGKLKQSQTELLELITAKEDEIALAPVPGGEERQLGVRLGEKEKVDVVPDPTRRVDKKPRRLEVKAEEIVLHPEKKKFAVKELDQMGSSLARFLGQVDQARNREYLLFLVHPNGAGAYEKIRKYLLEHHSETIEERTPLGGGVVQVLTIKKTRIDVGVEPFSSEWLLIDQ